MKLVIRTLILLGCVLLGACTAVDRRVLDDLGLVLMAGYDRIGSDKLQITVTLPGMIPEGRFSPQLLTVVARSEKNARKQLSYLSGKRVEAGQLKVILFGEKTARRGIKDIVDPLYRDPSIGSMMFVGVVKGKAADALKADVRDKQGAGLYTYNVLHQEERVQGTTRFRLSSVIRDLKTPGRAVAVPYMIVEKQGIKLSGLALFSDSKMSGRLPAELVPSYMMLDGVNYRDHLNMVLDKKTKITLSFVKNSRIRSVSYNPQTKKLTLHIKAKVKGQVLEYEGVQVKTRKQLRNLEEKVARHLEQQGEETMRILQKANSDAMGLGNYVQAKNVYSSYSPKWWQAQYPHIKVNVEMEVKLTRLGLLR